MQSSHGELLAVHLAGFPWPLITLRHPLDHSVPPPPHFVTGCNALCDRVLRFSHGALIGCNASRSTTFSSDRPATGRVVFLSAERKCPTGWLEQDEIAVSGIGTIALPFEPEDSQYGKSRFILLPGAVETLARLKATGRTI